MDTHGDWGGAHDWVPCSHARFLQVEQEEFLQVEQEEWINNTTFCVGSDSVCTVSRNARQFSLLKYGKFTPRIGLDIKNIYFVRLP